MDKVLFIIPAYNTNRPQAVRFRNIIPHLKNKFEIHLLYPSDVRNDMAFERDGIIIHESNGSLFGHFVNPVYYNKFYFREFKLAKFIRHGSRLIFRSILFPDPFILELRKLKKSLKRLTDEHKFKAIVISCAPFTLLKLGPFIKKITKDTLWIVDVGDPFYKNDVNKYPIQKLFAKNFESNYLKYVDKFIVTNKPTLEHYLKTFKHSIHSNKIFLIPHGTVNNNEQDFESEILLKEVITIVYIGIFYKKLREPFELYKAIVEFNNNNPKKLHLDIYGVTPPFFQKLPAVQSKYYIKFNDSVNHEIVNDIYSKSDFVLLIDNAFGFQTPGKVFELISTGKPILFLYSNPESATLSILKDYDGAILIKNNKLNIVNVFNEIFSKSSFRFSTSFNLKPYLWSNISNDFYNLIKE